VKGNANICLMAPDGSGQHALTADGDQKGGLSWSPDGTRLLYQTQEGIRVVAPGGTPRLVVPGGSAPTWSPGGARIAYGTSDGLWTIDPDGHNPTRIATLPAATPSWYPDGTAIAFVGTRSYPELGNRFGIPSRSDVYVVGAGGSNLRRLTGPPGVEYSLLPAGSVPTWWPDGSRLFYQSAREYNNASVFMMNPDGTCEGRFVEPPLNLSQPTWRPGSGPGQGTIHCA